MAESKKYYWLKLYDNFFEREEIKVIENMPNGKDYIIFYMKLLLKSIKTEGKLRFRDVIPYTPEMLSSITNTNIDTVRVAMQLFIDLKLMDLWDDKTLFMVETQNMIGSETDAAIRKRKEREQKKQLSNKGDIKELPQGCDNVTPMSQGSQNESQNGHTEIEIEIEKEIEIDIELDKDIDNKAIELCKYFEELKPGLSITKDISTLKIFLEDYEYDWCKEALQKTVIGTGKFVPNYMGKILQDWQSNGKPEKKGDKEDGSTGQNNEKGKGKYSGFKPPSPKIGTDIDTTDVI